MADQYIDVDHMCARLGGDFVDAVDGLRDISGDAICADATAEVQGLLRKHSWAVPSPTTTDGIVLNATVWLAWTQFSQIPDSSISLPEKFEENLYYRAWKSVVDGTAALTLPYLPADPIAGAQLVGDRVI